MKKKKGKAKVQASKKIIREFYYMLPAKTNVKDISANITGIAADHIELWNELDLMEIILENDSVIFQNAMDVFEDPLDLAYIKEHNIETIYQVSFDTQDAAAVKELFMELLQSPGGMFCSDTDDFQPVYTAHTIVTFTA